MPAEDRPRRSQGRSDGSDGRRQRRQDREQGRSQARPQGRRGRRQGQGGEDRRDQRRSGRQQPRADRERDAEQQRYDGPPIPDEITGRELDRSVRQQLRSLPEKLGQRVARHLVAAGQLLDSDPETAYRHTLAARARAARLAVVREACGEAAYLAGHYAEALTDLRAARRMNGSNAYLALIADCERALGRPERALDLAKPATLAELDQDTRIELMIVASGARLDVGQPDLAAGMLEGRDLRRNEVAAWAARLRYAYAEALLAAGRRTDAVEWFHRAVAVDAESVTDAPQRLRVLEDGDPGAGESGTTP